MSNSNVCVWALLATVLLAGSAPRVNAVDGWMPGRATWFDVENDDLKTANCHLPWSAIRTGRDVGAFSDANPLFGSSCGMCLEVKCENTMFGDGLGNLLDRRTACRGGQSVFVTIADACPCSYPNNAYSNRRWCCGDDPNRQHLDITRTAFNFLADFNLGAIGIQWRQVDCSQVKPRDTSLDATAVTPTATATATAEASAGPVPWAPEGGGGGFSGWFGGQGGLFGRGR